MLSDPLQRSESCSRYRQMVIVEKEERGELDQCRELVVEE